MFILLLGSYGVSAQSTFGVKVALGTLQASETESMVSTDGIVVSHNLKFLDYSNANSIGLYANKEANFLFVQAEVLYTTYKANYSIISYIDDDLPTTMLEETSQNLDLHVIGGLKFNNFKIGVGPVFHKSLDFNSDLSQFGFYNEKRRNLSAGFQAMIAYDLGLFTVDLKYEDAFNNVGDHIYFGNNKSKFKSNLSVLTLGLGIGF